MKIKKPCYVRVLIGYRSSEKEQESRSFDLLIWCPCKGQRRHYHAVLTTSLLFTCYAMGVSCMLLLFAILALGRKPVNQSLVKT